MLKANRLQSCATGFNPRTDRWLGGEASRRTKYELYVESSQDPPPGLTLTWWGRIDCRGASRCSGSIHWPRQRYAAAAPRYGAWSTGPPSLDRTYPRSACRGWRLPGCCRCWSEQRTEVTVKVSSLWYFSLFLYYLRIENAEGYVLIAVYLFIYSFVCVLLA